MAHVKYLHLSKSHLDSVLKIPTKFLLITHSSVLGKWYTTSKYVFKKVSQKMKFCTVPDSIAYYQTLSCSRHVTIPFFIIEVKVT